MPKFADELLVTKVFVACLKRSRTIEEITRHIYKNGYAKNQLRVFQTIETFIGEGIIVPKVSNGSLRFQINTELIKELMH